MPTYEYECRQCGHHCDVFQSITAKPLTRCPACKRPSLRRLIGSGAGIIFRGPGFYQTDYRSDHYRKQSAAEKHGADAGKPKPGGASPGKPAAGKADKAASAAP